MKPDVIQQIGGLLVELGNHTIQTREDRLKNLEDIHNKTRKEAPEDKERLMRQEVEIDGLRYQIRETKWDRMMVKTAAEEYATKAANLIEASKRMLERLTEEKKNEHRG